MVKVPSQISKFLPGKNRFIGLDMGSFSIKLAEFAPQGGKLSLIRLKLEEIDLQKDIQKATLNALKKLFQDLDGRQAKVNVVFNCPRSTTKILTLPYMPKAEILRALKWGMKDSISFPIDEAALDYQILQEVSEGAVKKLRLAVACSPAQTIKGCFNLLNQSVVQPFLFTQHAFTLKNIITNLAPEADKTIAVLDIGYNFSELFIFRNRDFSFSRKLPIVGRDFTRCLTQVLVSELGRLELTLDEAEKIKRRYGIPDAGSSGILEGKLTGAQLISLLRPNVEKLAEEIERSFDFYREKEKGERIERLILLGGGSNLNGLAKALSQSLDIPVELGNPLTGLLLKESSLFKDSLNCAHRYASAIGAALSLPDAVNLLPGEIKEQIKMLIVRSSIKALVTAIIVILILTYTGMKIGLGAYDKRIAAAKFELNVLTLRMKESQKKVFLAGVLKNRVYWSDALKEIGNRVPEQVRLTEMNTEKKMLILKGEIKPSELAEEKVLDKFINSLKKGIFKEVNLLTTKKGSTEGSPFTFELSLRVE
ncbi:MAG: pilus assembly protein PilM [Candidatus Omnitrophica bacterium]|nr:pilus assembly protein PilM [Candidatus Omnitrophota bacterium]